VSLGKEAEAIRDCRAAMSLTGSQPLFTFKPMKAYNTGFMVLVLDKLISWKQYSITNWSNYTYLEKHRERLEFKHQVKNILHFDIQQTTSSTSSLQPISNAILLRGLDLSTKIKSHLSICPRCKPEYTSLQLQTDRLSLMPVHWFSYHFLFKKIGSWCLFFSPRKQDALAFFFTHIQFGLMHIAHDKNRGRW
jgi:hypothetical protein